VSLCIGTGDGDYAVMPEFCEGIYQLPRSIGIRAAKLGICADRN